MNADEVAALLQLAPLPVEGGFFRQIWRSPADADHPAGTAIIAMVTDAPDGFSQFHRLDVDELWHFYVGVPLELILLSPGGESEHIVLGTDLAGGHVLVHIVPAGTWMAARSTGRWSVFGNTMAPGFTEARYEGADLDELLAGWPHERNAIHDLTRPGSARHMPTMGRDVPTHTN